MQAELRVWVDFTRIRILLNFDLKNSHFTIFFRKKVNIIDGLILYYNHGKEILQEKFEP